MKYQAGILLLKNKLRIMKGTIRHSWQMLIGLIVACGVLMYQFFSVIAKVGYGTGATERGEFYTLLIVAAFNLFRVFLNQTPVFRIEAASVLYTYNTRHFRKILQRRQLASTVYSAFVSGIIACFLGGFVFNLVFLRLWLILTLYICSCSFLSWIFYHAKGKIRWIICIIFPLCSALLFLKSVFSAIVLAVSLGCVWFYARHFLRLNLPKYFERLQNLEAASAALIQNDYAKMQQLSEENRPSYVRGPMLYQFKPTKRTALWVKSLLELLRIQKPTVILLVIILLGGWIVNRTTLFTFLPLLDNSVITHVIAVFCTATAISGFYQLLVKNAKTVSDKRKLGLSLPYSTKQVIVSYGMTAIILNLFLTLAVSLLYTIFSIRIIPLLFAEALVYIVPCCAQLYEIKFRRGVITFSRMLLFAAVYWYLMV